MNRWSDRTLKAIGRTAAVTSMTLAVAALVIYVVIGETGAMYDDWALHNVLTTITLGTVTLLAVPTQHRNRAVHVIGIVVLFGALQAIGAAVGLAVEGFSNGDIQGLRVSRAPSDLGLVSAIAFQTTMWAWIPSMFTAVTVLLIRAPNGDLPSPRWRWIEWTAIGMIIVSAAAFFLGTAPWSDTPYNVFFDGGETAVAGLGLGGLSLIAAASLVGLVGRARRATGVERLQLRWLVWGIGSVAVGSLTLFISTDLWRFLGLLLVVNAATSIGIAITKHRLYGIDIIINRALVLGSLALFISAIYVTIVVGIGSAFGGSSLWLSITATAFVAIVFEPVRARLQRWVNRLVYGSRATPYEVLSDLTRRLAAAETGDGLLERMAMRLSEGTGAERAAVWLVDGGTLRPAAGVPQNGHLPGRVHSIEEVEGATVRIEHEGEVLGALAVEKKRGDALTPTEQQLMADLAGSAGLVIRRLRLDEALALKAQELEESRRRLLDAEDVERRRLERDLHDGAQQHVVSLAEKLRLAGRIAEDEGTEQTTGLIAQMAMEADDAIEQIRALAQGIYPPLLEAHGLEHALPTLASRSPQVVHMDVRLGTRYPLPMEGAVYFCVSEALTNAAKHGEGPVHVAVGDEDGALTFSVLDSGPGFDTAVVARGAGLDNMTDRLNALGGSVTIESSPGGSTVVRGVLPVFAST